MLVRADRGSFLNGEHVTFTLKSAWRVKPSLTTLLVLLTHLEPHCYLGAQRARSRS